MALRAMFGNRPWSDHMMAQITLPFPLPSPGVCVRVVQVGMIFGPGGRTLLDKRRTPRGCADHVLTDHEVELVRQVYEMGGISLRQVAEKFEVSKQHIHDIVTFRRRAYAG
jgi:hypothetical protein